MWSVLKAEAGFGRADAKGKGAAWLSIPERRGHIIALKELADPALQWESIRRKKNTVLKIAYKGLKGKEAPFKPWRGAFGKA